jgi:hypothetical protein
MSGQWLVKDEVTCVVEVVFDQEALLYGARTVYDY